MNWATKDRGRMEIDVVRRAVLLDVPGPEDEDFFRKGHGFHLIVRHVDAGGRQTLMQAAQFDAHLVAEVGVKVRERLVEEEDARLAHDGPAHGHALALAAGKLLRHPLKQTVEPEEPGRFFGAALALLRRDAAHLEAVGDVVEDVHVRIKGIVLEHHRDVAVLGFLAGDILVPDRGCGRP